MGDTKVMKKLCANIYILLQIGSAKLKRCILLHFTPEFYIVIFIYFCKLTSFKVL